MRKLASILLLACLCVALFGYHFVFYFQLARAKSEMMADLKKQKHHKDVAELSFGTEELKDLEWENDHEFRYHGEMYDLLEKKTDSAHTMLRCIADKKETALVNAYQKNGNSSRALASFLQLIAAPFVLPPGYTMGQPEKKITERFPDRLFPLHSRSSSLFIPPPEAC